MQNLSPRTTALALLGAIAVTVGALILKDPDGSSQYVKSKQPPQLSGPSLVGRKPRTKTEKDPTPKTVKAKIETLSAIESELRQATLNASLSNEEREALRMRIEQLAMQREVLLTRSRAAETVKRKIQQ